MAQPNVEVIRQVSVAYVIVVGRVGRNDLASAQTLNGRICSERNAADMGGQRASDHFCNPTNTAIKIPRCFAERISFNIVPSHWNGLATERIDDSASCRCGVPSC